MTREEILKLEGRELDVAIYRNVITENWIRGMYSDIEYETMPHYSTEISAAWEVVEVFKLQGYLFALKTIVSGEYTFSLTDWNGNCNTYSSQSKAAPEAICRAALLAVLETNP